jgi:hypothetical protein
MVLIGRSGTGLEAIAAERGIQTVTEHSRGYDACAKRLHLLLQRLVRRDHQQAGGILIALNDVNDLVIGCISSFPGRDHDACVRRLSGQLRILVKDDDHLVVNRSVGVSKTQTDDPMSSATRGRTNRPSLVIGSRWATWSA